MFSAVERAGIIGASDVRAFMAQTSELALLRWWEIKVGLREPDPQTWAMRLGNLLGDPILDEYERNAGVTVTRRQEKVPSPANKRIVSTLDGFVENLSIVLEAKFASPYLGRDDLFAMYYPQVATQMHCCNVDRAMLIAAQGTNDPIEIECVREASYEQILLERCEAMLESIDTMTPPVLLPAPVPPEKWRSIDLSIERPNWSAELEAALAGYDATAEAAKAHDECGKLARELIPDDVGRVIAGAFNIARNKRGTLAITRRAA